MTLPKEFNEKNIEKIRIYHYVEELIGSYKTHIEQTYIDEEISIMEYPFLLRIKFIGKCNQIDLVEIFHISEGYTAKILKKFETLKLIERKEDPKNRRKKIVTLTEKGNLKAEKILKATDKWEDNVTKTLNKQEKETLKKLLYKTVKQTEQI